MKSNSQLQEVLFFKLDGDPIKDGIIDAKSAANLLQGIDDTLKYFVSLEDPDLDGMQIPITTKKGSWQVSIVDIAKLLVAAGGTAFAAKYFGKAAEKMAENDFKDVGFRSIFQAAGKKIVKVIKFAKHLGTLKQKKFSNVKFRNNNRELGISNEKGELMWVPVEVVEFIAETPPNFFSKLIAPVTVDQDLTVGYTNANGKLEEEVVITIRERRIFVLDELEDDEIVLPQLEHNQRVTLTGHVTRGNEKTNTIGFLYDGHILTCSPREGNVKKHKMSLFTKCKISGVVDRMSKEGNFIEKKPRIIFTSLKPLPKKGSNQLEIDITP